ncbi:hypothetical protein C2I18_16720 [Paenibacillus sp. PK3_47]|uniref:hypothetical protein n=1 Tax=Paenibacillus sp. PK3_47 TaxID=2072642 RepID=UPI00201D6EE6|nr:hypothetical protein [Paenibacillus sp. PK3_47]UQZ35021.1 hypothetical protein C2I18_16720 [Paenibacillus sp. PK3_47]
MEGYAAADPAFIRQFGVRIPIACDATLVEKCAIANCKDLGGDSGLASGRAPEVLPCSRADTGE